jgi:predicted RNase H-like HicB family nuclease
MKDHHINVFWSEADSCYVADIPDLHFCSAFGSSPANAVTQVVIAKEAWLATAKAEGKPIPEPIYDPTSTI